LEISASSDEETDGPTNPSYILDPDVIEVQIGMIRNEFWRTKLICLA
jgi:hypothetical protein